MRNYVSILLLASWCCLLPHETSAQWGLRADFLSHQREVWYVGELSNPNTVENMLDQGWALGLNYWFRLKNYRLEFFPELNYGRSSTDLSALHAEGAALNVQHHRYSFYANTQLYFLDLEGDCDCPTFSKQGPSLSKGIFAYLSPGFSVWESALEGQEAGRAALWSLGAGLGVDVGLSDLLTLTPIVGARYFFGSERPEPAGLTEQLAQGYALRSEQGMWQYALGLRLGMRFDYSNGRRRR